MSLRRPQLVTALGACLLLALCGCSGDSDPPHAKAAAAATLNRPGTNGSTSSEDEKVEGLLQKIAATKDAVFIRNGKEYNATEAAEFIRAKLGRYKEQVKTADDFIRVVASKSNTTGEAYHIRLKDGTTMESGEFLRKQLGVTDGVARRP